MPIATVAVQVAYEFLDDLDLFHQQLSRYASVDLIAGERPPPREFRGSIVAKVHPPVIEDT